MSSQNKTFVYSRRFCFFLIFFFSCSFAKSEISDIAKYKTTKSKYKLSKVSEGLDFPWGMTFIDDENLLITEKKGRLLKINKSSGKQEKIQHSIQSISYNQGGLLDVYNNDDGYIYFTYSHKNIDKSLKDQRRGVAASTGVVRGKLDQNKIKDLQILLLAKPESYIHKHFGSRIVIKNKHLYASFGERDEGMIAQDPSKHPGSIIRINTDGSIPENNPAFLGYSKWLPEIYQIGVRNPQGMTMSPYDGKIYLSQHGPRGGDNIGVVSYGGNYGWRDIAWGGKEYSGLKIGSSPFKDIYDKPLKTWVPSIGIGNLTFYEGNTFPEWNGDLIISATKSKMLIRLDFENNKIVDEEIIFQDEIGRIRDLEVDNEGDIYLIIDQKNSALWKLSKE
ncbi:MAG: glucose dehydrogenase [Rickettsiales bacterium]|nr:glucose dehydrogenase [Rickettsiales bacterium]